MPPPDKRKPFPDKAHEDLARWVEETIAGLKQAQADVGDSFLLADTLFGLVDSTLTDIGTGQADAADHLLLVDVLFGLVDGLLTSLDAQRIRIDAVNVRCDTAQDGIDALQQQVAALTARLDAHVTAGAMLPGPNAAG